MREAARRMNDFLVRAVYATYSEWKIAGRLCTRSMREESSAPLTAGGGRGVLCPRLRRITMQNRVACMMTIAVAACGACAVFAAAADCDEWQGLPCTSFSTCETPPQCNGQGSFSLFCTGTTTCCWSAIFVNHPGSGQCVQRISWDCCPRGWSCKCETQCFEWENQVIIWNQVTCEED